MADYIGEGPALRLVANFGGLDIRIPKLKHGKMYQHLESVMGADIAAELVRVFGGESLYIAKNAKEARQIHRRVIAEYRAAGKTWQQIASGYTFINKFSERWIRKLGAADQPGGPTPRPPGSATSYHANQPGLFGIPAPHSLDALSRRN